FLLFAKLDQATVSSTGKRDRTFLSVRAKACHAIVAFRTDFSAARRWWAVVQTHFRRRKLPSPLDARRRRHHCARVNQEYVTLRPAHLPRFTRNLSKCDAPIAGGITSDTRNCFDFGRVAPSDRPNWSQTPRRCEGDCWNVKIHYFFT